MNLLLLLLLSFTQSTSSASLACPSLDGEQVYYDPLCKTVPYAKAVENGCFYDNRRECRRCTNEFCQPEGNILEGDIRLETPVEVFLEQQRKINTALEQEITENTGIFSEERMRNAVRNRLNLWRSARVPYKVSNKDFSHADNIIIEDAIATLNRLTCVTIVPANDTDKDFINIIRGRGCYSVVGKVDGAQPLSLGFGCVNKGIVMHELMHALGFFHEQSRTDRDSYVEIHWNNILENAANNFQKFTLKQVDSLGKTYDYDSILHYTPYAFSKNGMKTIDPVTAGINIRGSHNRPEPSKTDIEKIKILYECPNVSNCKDREPLCVGWAKNGQCEDTLFMKKACSVSCFGECPEKCADYSDDCAFWYDTDGKTCNTFMKSVCPQICGLCT